MRFDGNSIDVNFTICALTNSLIIGELQILNNYYAVNNCYSSSKKFQLTGRENCGDDIICDDCYLTSLYMDIEILKPQPRKEGDVKAQGTAKFITSITIIQNKNIESVINSDTISINFEISGMLETSFSKMKVNIAFLSGFLLLKHRNNIKELQEVMIHYRVSSVTSDIKLELTKDRQCKISEILDSSEKFVSNFLKVTSLAQGTWHNWTHMSITDGFSNKNHPLVSVIRSVKDKHLVPRFITDLSNSNKFISVSWSGYSETMNQIYGFDYALNWYVVSNSSDTIESRYLNAMTSFEMLMDKFHSSENTEFLLADKKFNDLKTYFKDMIREKLSEEPPYIRASIYSNLNSLRRRSLVQKAKMLLEFWQIKFDDIGVNLDKIKDIRNEITHKGRYYSPGSKMDETNLAYKALITLLVRLFLAIVKYDGIYKDPVKGWINFHEVRTM